MQTIHSAFNIAEPSQIRARSLSNISVTAISFRTSSCYNTTILAHCTTENQILFQCLSFILLLVELIRLSLSSLQNDYIHFNEYAFKKV